MCVYGKEGVGLLHITGVTSTALNWSSISDVITTVTYYDIRL